MNRHQIYTSPSLPTAYIVKDPDGKLWTVPGNHWTDRRPYQGYESSLEPMFGAYDPETRDKAQLTTLRTMGLD